VIIPQRLKPRPAKQNRRRVTSGSSYAF